MAMKAELSVLQARYPDAPRLHSQRVDCPAWPLLHERFLCVAEGRPFSTERVVHVTPLQGRAVYFTTKHTAYLIERVDS